MSVSFDAAIQSSRERLEDLQNRLAAAEKEAAEKKAEGAPTQEFKIPEQTATYSYGQNKPQAEPARSEPLSIPALKEEIEKEKRHLADLELMQEKLPAILAQTEGRPLPPEGQPSPAEVDRHKPDELQMYKRWDGLSENLKDSIDLMHQVGRPDQPDPAVIIKPDVYTGPEVGLMVAATLVEAGQKKIPELAEKLEAEAEMVAKGVVSTAKDIEVNAGVAVLMAEKTLQEEQEKLKQSADLVEINASYAAKQVKEGIAETKDKLNDGWDKVVERVNDAVDKAKEATLASMGDREAQDMFEKHARELNKELDYLKEMRSNHEKKCRDEGKSPDETADHMKKVTEAAKLHMSEVIEAQQKQIERQRDMDQLHRAHF